MANTNNSGNGIGFGTLLFLVFLVLKLTNYIDWSWWWITAPLWVSVIIILGVVTLVYYLKQNN